MKILVISHEFPPIGGGGANACYYLTKGYAKLGNEVTIVTANYNGMKEQEIGENITIFRVNSKRKNKAHCSFAEMGSYLLKAFPLVNKLVKQQKFDVCQVFFGLPSGPLGFWVKKKYKVPYVVRLGGGDIPGAQKRYTVIYKVLAPFLKAIWRNADGVVANSEGLRNRALKFYDKKKIEIIPNGVDIDYFVPLEKHTTSKEMEILFVSRLIKGKGLQFVIPHMKEINESIDKKVKLVVVGDGPYKEPLEQLASESDTEEYVEFKGFKNKDEILNYYQRADLFILPSEKEGMPNVVLEAMSSGLPIVMTPCEGAKELMSDNGIVAKQTVFAEEVKKLLQNEPLMKKMAAASREKTVKEFSWEKIVGQYLSLFDRCV